MVKSRLPTALLWVAAIVLAIITVWLFLANPTVERPDFGSDAGCAAPYDTVLNGEDNVPGGEPAPDGEEVGAACRTAGKDMFALGLGFAAASLALALVLLTRRRPQVHVASTPSATDPSRAAAIFSAATHTALLMGLLLLVPAVFFTFTTLTEDVADLRSGDKPLGGFGYVPAAVFWVPSIATLTAFVLGLRLWNQQRTSAATTLVAIAGGIALSIIALVGLMYLSLG